MTMGAPMTTPTASRCMMREDGSLVAKTIQTQAFHYPREG